MKKGVFIVFEGLDGTGKTTQVSLLADFFRSKGWEVLQTREPTDGQWGRKIREIALNGRDGITADEEMEIFVRDREEHVREEILPALEAGQAVICDRYYHSNIAYQGALGLEPELIRKANEEENDFPRPDIVFYLRARPETGIGRIRSGREGGTNEGYEKIDFLKKVMAFFDGFSDPFIHRLDGEKSIEEIAAEIRTSVEALTAVAEKL